VRRTLVAALISCAGERARTPLRRFLTGLSADELEFLAGFQGARILEQVSGECSAGRPPAAARTPVYRSTVTYDTADLDHKMIVLREYLARCDGQGRSC